MEIWAGFLRVKCVGAIRPIEQGLGGEMGRVEVARGGEPGGRGTGWGEGGLSKNRGSEEKIYAEVSRWVCEVMPVKGKSAE